MKKKIPILILLIAVFAAVFLSVRFFTEKKPQREITSCEACVVKVYEKSILCYIAQTNPHHTDLCSFGINPETEILDEEGKRTTKEAFRPGQMLILEVDVPIQYTYPANYPETVRITLTGKTDEALLRKGEEKVLLLGGSE